MGGGEDSADPLEYLGRQDGNFVRIGVSVHKSYYNFASKTSILCTFTPLPAWGRWRYETAEIAGVEGQCGFVPSYHLFLWCVTAACPSVLQGLSPSSAEAPRPPLRLGGHLHGLVVGRGGTGTVRT